jgi:TatD DNase family protein
MNLMPAEFQNAVTPNYCSLGLHPWYIDDFAEENMKLLRQYSSEKSCVAIGEAGLDKVTETDFALQEKIFKHQAELAAAINKPLIIHCVKAYGEILKIRMEMKVGNPWIFHGFNSSAEMAEQLLAHDCMPSFGIWLFKTPEKAAQILKKLTPSQYFLETDDSDKSIEEVYQQAARIADIDIAELISIQYLNFRRIFPEVQL